MTLTISKARSSLPALSKKLARESTSNAVAITRKGPRILTLA